MIDTEEGGTITVKLAGGSTQTFDIPKIGDGEIAQVLLDVQDVVELTVDLDGSGAIDDLCYMPGKNVDPTAADASGKTCADEILLLDLLEGADDPDGDTAALTVASISDDDEMVGVGGTITLADGAKVTLNADGTVSVDGAEAYEDLGIGDSAADSFIFTVEDADGGTASAQADVTFCGAYETLAELGASLPLGEVSFQIVDNNIPFGSSDEAYSLQFIAAEGDTRFEGVTFENAYCVAAFDNFLTGDSFTNAPVLTGTLSLIDDDTVFGSGILDTLADADPEIEDSELDNLINYILNTDWESMGYTDDEVQGAIWGITDSALFVPNGSGIPDQAAQEILADAIANGQDFQVQEGDVVGVFIDSSPKSVALGHTQPFVVGVLWDECIC